MNVCQQIMHHINAAVMQRTARGCPRPCNVIKYTVEKGRMGRNTCPTQDICSFSVYFGSETVKIEQEYRHGCKKTLTVL